MIAQGLPKACQLKSEDVIMALAYSRDYLCMCSEPIPLNLLLNNY